MRNLNAPYKYNCWTCYLKKKNKKKQAALKDYLKHYKFSPKEVQHVRSCRGVAEKWLTAREEMEDKKWYFSKY